MSHRAKNPVDQLVQFTGFYALEGRPGAFVLIDTNLIYTRPAPDVMPTMVNQASVSICIDGTSVDEFAFDPCCTFDGRHLTVTLDKKVVAKLRLFKDHSDGNSSGLTGTIGGHAVHGTTPFGPIALPVFAGEYFLQQPDGSYQPQLEIGADYSVSYNSGTGFSPVTAYGFNFAMFVIQFEAIVDKKPKLVTYEMGTTPKNGLVAGNSAGGTLLVSIRKTNVYPPPKS
jgi:hypothetical protein